MGTVEARERRRRLSHARFVETGQPAPDVRSEVADSWARSAAAGVDPDGNPPPVVLDGVDLRSYRAEHPLARVFPVLYDIVGRVAEDCGYVMAVGDADGRLLWVTGQPAVLRRAASINFVEGAVWDEVHAGTNAPGMALHLDTAVQVHSAEHFTRPVQPFSCAAAPIHDPVSRRILGLLDVTGGADVASPQTLGLIRAAARMAESELARFGGASGDPARAGSPSGRLRGLGRDECVLHLHGSAIRLSRRHSDILAVLTDNPQGLSAEQLEIEVYPADVHGSTMRAEMTRLRALLGPELLQSRPYRLTGELQSDWQTVAEHVDAGRLRQALDAYAGPLLPRSEAPGVVALRTRLDRQLREAILSSDDPDLLAGWTRTRWGADDLDGWLRQCRTLPHTSALLPLARAEVWRLERELG